jgi:hypothetical protein
VNTNKPTRLNTRPNLDAPSESCRSLGLAKAQPHSCDIIMIVITRPQQKQSRPRPDQAQTATTSRSVALAWRARRWRVYLLAPIVAEWGRPTSNMQQSLLSLMIAWMRWLANATCCTRLESTFLLVIGSREDSWLHDARPIVWLDCLARLAFASPRQLACQWS